MDGGIKTGGEVWMDGWTLTGPFLGVVFFCFDLDDVGTAPVADEALASPAGPLSMSGA